MEGNLFINLKCVTKEANQNTHLKEHIKAVHEGKKPFECWYCHYKFSEKSNLKTHVYNSWIEKANKVWFLHLSIPRSLGSTHNVSTWRKKPFQCWCCHLKFSENSNFKTHVYNSWMEKGYQCYICDVNNSTYVTPEADNVSGLLLIIYQLSPMTPQAGKPFETDSYFFGW